jgi:hypothetical protein
MTSTQHPVDTFLAEISEGAGISTSVWTEDATLDATVPHWRFECDGAEAVAAQLSAWYDAPTTIESLVRRPIPGGESVELDLSWVEGGVPHAAHQVHLITVAGDRINGYKIIRDTVFCGGRWPAALLAEMEAARGH